MKAELGATMTARSQNSSSWGQRLAVLVPYLWLAAFFLAPFLIVLKISLSQTALAQPPYSPVLDLAAGLDGCKRIRQLALVPDLFIARIRLDISLGLT